VLKLDGEAINKKDWECLFLSPSNVISFEDKITLKSPIYAELLNLVSTNVDLPEYIQLQNAWLDLTEVLSQAFNQQMDALNLDLELVANELSVNALTSNLAIKLNKTMSYFDLRLTLLKWFTKRPQNKFRLIVFEYPELYSNKDQLKDLTRFVNELSTDTYFIAVANYNFSFSSKNVLLKDMVVNHYYVDMLREAVRDKMPFVMPNEDFDLAADTVINAFDKYDFYTSLNALPLKSVYIATDICLKLGADIDIRLIKSKEVQKFFENC
jgi:hypothetical protein